MICVVVICVVVACVRAGGLDIIRHNLYTGATLGAHRAKAGRLFPCRSHRRRIAAGVAVGKKCGKFFEGKEYYLSDRKKETRKEGVRIYIYI